MRHKFPVLTVKKLLKPVSIYGSYRKNKTGAVFLEHPVCYSICYSAYMLSSVCLSHGWISQKRLKLGSCNFHHRVAPWLLVSSWLISPRNSKENIGSEDAK